MKVKNPNYVDPFDAKIDQYRQAFIDYVATLPDTQQWIDFDQLRVDFNKTEEQFPDGELVEIFLAIGIAPEDIQDDEF